MEDDTGGRRRSWWAIVGPLPSSEPTGWLTTPHDRTRVLDREYEVGPLRLRPGGKRLVEYLRLDPLALEGIRRSESWPLLVESSWEDGLPRIFASGPEEVRAAKPTWPAIERQGSEDLHRLCALLSLAWGEPWQVRTSPKPSEHLDAEVPDSWPAPPRWHQDDDFPPSHQEGLPDWISTAWDQVGTDDHVAAALTAWHQGLLLTPQHPSFAHVALVGAIEELSHASPFAAIVDNGLPVPCHTCDARHDASQRFWRMVRQVAAGAEVAELKELNPLGKRGAAAHGARLPGIETTYGSVVLLDWIPPSPEGDPPRFEFNPDDPAQIFVLKVVPAVRGIARRLLLKALGAPANSFTPGLGAA